MKKLILAVCLVMCLAGCGNNSTEDKAKDSKASAESAVSSAEESKFDSHITYTCEKAADDAELDKVADALDARYSQAFSESEHTIKKDYENKEIRLEFDNTEGTEDFAETSNLANIVKFIKGEDKSGEVILTNENIESCEKQMYVYAGDGSERWVVTIQFDDEGKQLFADATTELSEKKMPISVWLNDEMISAPMVNEPIMDGKCQISGDFDEEKATELADKIAMKPLPFDITVKESELNK
ncbi:SecDF P1 head subdomain-containing protein [Ruminococcus albus]|uniref:SecDF P1 head subdomain-containing protein n=1 Tax=Ruminococcus albus TaxID=1264 RepID=UPI000466E15A|nr:hypothetical protein [Ruminococcus albus]